jgi:hypothetical protein
MCDRMCVLCILIFSWHTTGGISPTAAAAASGHSCAPIIQKNVSLACLRHLSCLHCSVSKDKTMMKAAILSILCVDAIAVAVAVAVAAKFSTENGGNEGMRYKDQIERALSGSGDMVSFDDAFWGYDQDRSSSVAWSDYSIIPKECLIL